MPTLTTNEQAVFQSLNPRELAFVKAFWGIGQQAQSDASKAIREAGYVGARANQAGYKMMQRPRVKRAFKIIQNAQDRAQKLEQRFEWKRRILEQEQYVQKLLGRVRRG